MTEATQDKASEAGGDLSLIEAVNRALRRALSEDPKVVLFGEDVGVDGGVFRATDGLLGTFGANRVRDTPLAELSIGGLAVGLAASGYRPVAEIQFMGFIYSAIDQIVNHASRLRNRTRGRMSCPMVLRAPFGGGIGAPEHHSESTEAMFTNIPGLRTVIPSSPARAFGLLLAAIADPDPVLFLEPKRIYRSAREPVDMRSDPLPLDTCFTVRDGRDVTLVSWGAMVGLCLNAADTLAAEGTDAAVIDVATLSPLDPGPILDSVGVTGRCVIVHEAPLTGGFGAEIAARIAEQGLFSLVAPIQRVTGYDTIMPYKRNERQYLPSEARIVAAVREAMAFE